MKEKIKDFIVLLVIVLCILVLVLIGLKAKAKEFNSELVNSLTEKPKIEFINENIDLKYEDIVEEDEWITAEFSAYNNVEEQCDSTPDITASGHKINGDEKIVAVNGYKFGTKIEIEGMGEYVVMDRMNRRYGINNIDILFHKDIDGALKFGRRELKYRVVK